jgi:hypothetical protein
MTNLKPIKVKWLAKILDPLVDAINARSITVSTGGGLDIQESPTGYLLKLSAGPTAQSGGGKGTSSDLTALTARVAALEAILAGSSWQSVDVMSSACVRSTIQVLEK